MAKTIWLQTDTGKNGGQFLIDADTRKAPTVISGNSLQIFLGAFRFDRPLDLGAFERINLIIRESQTDGTPAMVNTNVLAVDVTDMVTLTAWNNRTGYNAEFNVSAGEMEYDMGDDEQRTLWMVLTAFNDSSGAETVLGSAAITMYADNNSGSAGGAQYMLKEVYDTNGNGKVDVAELAEAVAWNNVTGKPGSFPADLTGAVRYDVAQSLDAGQQAQARSNIGAGTLSSLGTALLYSPQSLTSGQKLQALTNLGINNLSLDGALRYDQAQTLSPTQKDQALDNLGISGLSLDGAVLYSGPQSLNDEQKAQARDNIGAIGAGNLEGAVLYDQVQALSEGEKERARNNIGVPDLESSFAERVILFRKELDTVLGATANCLQAISWSGLSPTLPVVYAFVESSSGELLFYELKVGAVAANGKRVVLPNDYSSSTNPYYWSALWREDNPITTSGDIIIGGIGGEPIRLGVGSEGQILTVVNGVPAWADAPDFPDPTPTPTPIITPTPTPTPTPSSTPSSTPTPSATPTPTPTPSATPTPTPTPSATPTPTPPPLVTPSGEWAFYLSPDGPEAVPVDYRNYWYKAYNLQTWEGYEIYYNGSAAWGRGNGTPNVCWTLHATWEDAYLGINPQYVICDWNGDPQPYTVQGTPVFKYPGAGSSGWLAGNIWLE